MKDTGSLHLKVQELCDCFATADPLREMAALDKDGDKRENALKWIALAVLHGINGNAEKITLTRAPDGTVKVAAKYRKTDLPSPGTEVGGQVLEVIRGVAHLDQDGGKTPLALGVRDSSLTLGVKVRQEDGGERVTIEFPG